MGCFKRCVSSNFSIFCILYCIQQVIKFQSGVVMRSLCRDTRGNTHLHYSCRPKNVSVTSLLLYCLYAQGLPVLLTTVTALMDEVGPCEATRPNMGTLKCFVQSKYDPELSFTQSAQFLYHYLIVATLISVNISCFLLTGIRLCCHWRQMKDIKTSSGEGLPRQFLIVLKVSVIMGLPWVLDVVSAWATFHYGFTQSFYFRVSLDVVNLFTGVLIFLVLVGWTPIMKKIRESRLQQRLSYTKSSSLSRSRTDAGKKTESGSGSNSTTTRSI